MHADVADAAEWAVWTAAGPGPRPKAAVAAGRGVRQERSGLSLARSWRAPRPTAHAPVCDRRARDLISAPSVSICGRRSLLIQRIQSDSTSTIVIRRLLWVS